MTDLFSFLTAVLSHWIALMSGVVSLGIGLWQRARHSKLTDKIFWSVAGVCFSLAIFLAWRDEHTSQLTTKKELEEVTNPAAPRFRAEIEQVIVEDNHSLGGATVFVLLSVRNLGADSIAEKFLLHIRASDLEYKNGPTEFTGETPLTLPDGSKITLRRQDSLGVKASEPVRHGALIRGWLMFVMPKVKADALREPGTYYEVSFADVVNKQLSVTYTMPAR